MKYITFLVVVVIAHQVIKIIVSKQRKEILFHRLVSALPNHIILSQVQLSHFSGWNNSINRMSIDYLICDKDLSVKAAIKLSSKTDNSQKLAKQDEKKNTISNTGITLITLSLKNMPTREQILRIIETKETVIEAAPDIISEWKHQFTT